LTQRLCTAEQRHELLTTQLPNIMSTIAILGASPDRRKFANKCVRAYLAAGWTVYPVHPTAETVEGLPVVRSVAELPVSAVDRVSVYLPPSVGVTALETIGSKQVGEVWLNPGADAPAVITKAEELGLKVVCDCSIVAVGYSPSEFAES
jgi:hypothetical protein